MYRAVDVFSLYGFHKLVPCTLVLVQVKGYAEVAVAWLDFWRHFLWCYPFYFVDFFFEILAAFFSSFKEARATSPSTG